MSLLYLPVHRLFDGLDPEEEIIVKKYDHASHEDLSILVGHGQKR